MKRKTIISHSFPDFHRFHYKFINNRIKKERIYYEIIQKISSLISLAFLTANFPSNFTSAYADSTTKVNITNVDIASLSNSEKELIISRKPSGAVNSTNSVKLVYKKVACPIDKPSLPNTGHQQV